MCPPPRILWPAAHMGAHHMQPDCLLRANEVVHWPQLVGTPAKLPVGPAAHQCCASDAYEPTLTCLLPTWSQYVETTSAFGPVALGNVQCSCFSHHKDIKTPLPHQAEGFQVRWHTSA